MSFTKFNEMTIRRLSKFSVKTTKNENSDALVTAACLNLATLGFYPNEDAYNAMKYVANLDALITAAKALKGDNVRYVPMYPNFPAQVANASDVELYLNAILHYVGKAVGLRIMPAYVVESRAGLDEDVEVTVLGVAKPSDLCTLAADIMVSGQPFSATDKDDLALLAASGYLPKTAPIVSVKENVAYLAATYRDLDFTASFKTATDVLRLAVALSGGDVSLAENTKFISFSRADRRLILSLLDAVGNGEDMARWSEQWKRLARHLRVSDYAKRYPRAASLIADVTKGVSIESFNSKVEAAITVRDIPAIVGLLSQRPGEYARRLAAVLRVCSTNEEKAAVVAGFAPVAGSVSIPVLVQVWNYFSSQDASQVPQKTISVKSGANQRTHIIDNGRVASDIDPVIRAIAEDGIRSQGNLGKVYLDADLFSQFAVPMGVRSASASMRSVARGSRLDLSDKNTLRFFIHWKDVPGTYGTDIDLSAFMVDKDFKRTNQVAYYALRGGSYAVHSGDITSAPDGAAEFIDVDIDKAIAAGYRYIAMTVHSYSRQSFSEVPECYAGFMMRDEPQSGEIFEPSTVEQRIDLASNSKDSIPFLFDLVERKAVWWDNSGIGARNLHGSSSAVLNTMRDLMLSPRMDMAHLISLMADEIVTDRADADVVYDGQDISPYNMEKMLALLA